MDGLRFEQITSENIERLKSMHRKHFPNDAGSFSYSAIQDQFTCFGYFATALSVPIAEITLRWFYHDGKLELYISSLSVISIFRGKHIGLRLLNFAIAQNQEATSFFLHVRESNKIAISLYQKAGFKAEEKINDYYFTKFHSNALVFRKINPTPLQNNRLWSVIDFLRQSDLSRQVPYIQSNGGDDSKDESPEEQWYEVEAILNHRVVGGNMQYLVKWKGYSKFSNSWVDASNLNCQDLIDSYYLKKRKVFPITKIVGVKYTPQGIKFVAQRQHGVISEIEPGEVKAKCPLLAIDYMEKELFQ